MVSLTGDGMGSGWGFSVIPLWEGKLSFVLHMLPLHEPVISFGFHCVDSKQHGICWRSPASQMQRNRDIALLDPAQPQEGGGSPSGEKAALELPGDCHSAYGLSPERDRKPYM